MWRCSTPPIPYLEFMNPVDQWVPLSNSKNRISNSQIHSKMSHRIDQRFFSWVPEGLYHESVSSRAIVEHDPAGVARRPSCRYCSRTCRQSKRSTSNLQCASRSIRSSELSTARRPYFRAHKPPRAVLSSRSRYGTVLETSQSIR